VRKSDFTKTNQHFLMRRRFRYTKEPVEISKPTGTEWIPIGELRLWLPHKVRARANALSLPSESYIETHGAGWAVARSGLDFILRCRLGPKAKYKIERVSKLGYGLSKEVHRAEVRFFQGGEESFDTFAVSRLSYSASAEAGPRMIAEQFLLDAMAHKTAAFSVPEIRIAVQWISSHLPPEQGCVFLHGDLPGQNILLLPPEEISVIEKHIE
jgi:hypothetical protein